MNTVIQTVDLSKQYRSGTSTTLALKKANLTVQSGELVALEGPSGSGKSTLLNLCGLIDTLTEGVVRIGDQDIASLKENQRIDFRRKNLGFIFQSFNLVPVMSAYENVEYPLLLLNTSAKERRLAVETILERVGLTPFAKNRPDKLSGGQRQRVAIARALVKRPLLVIADEPTASLDSKTAMSIIELMKSLAREYKTAFLIATHDDRMATHCDRRLLLVDGVMQ